LRDVEKCGRVYPLFWHIRQNRGLVFGIIALIYFLEIFPRPGATGPAFSTRQARLAARDD
jgi:hypothetical protein